MKQHDDDAVPSEVPRPRRRGTASRPAWPFPSGSLAPQGGGGSGSERGAEPAAPADPIPTPAPTERARTGRTRADRTPTRWPPVFVLVAGTFALHACGGGGGDGGSPAAPAKPPTAQAASVSLDVLGAAASTVSGKVNASDPQGLALTYTVSSAPSAGAVTVDARSGAFSYTVAGHPSAGQDSFTVSVSNGQAAAVNAVVTVQLNTDPLLAHQWHIRNVGTSAFSTVLPVAGNDMNVAGAWAAGYSGKGIKVGVVDTGLEAAHEDLAANVDVANSFNFLTQANDPTLAASISGHDHGTQVTGIIGSLAFNGKGGRGVAYNARLRGYNLIGNYSGTNYAASMGGMAISADNAIFNASFGRSTPSLPPMDQFIVNANAHLNTLRGGLGAILVNAAGNAFEQVDDERPQLCANANRYGVSCGDPAQDTRLGGTTPIIVGALTADGKRSSYSTTGSSLWVSAPGGEYGFDAAYFDVSGFSPTATRPAIVSTARSGCVHRDNAPGVGNALVTGNNRLALNCQYTAQMNGTSSAAPNTSATIALMLEANPRLTARDVKFILAKTARRVDPGWAGVTATDIIAGSRVTLEQGWVRNAAGHWYSNWYGFGAVDTAAAVEMAKGYTTTLPAAQTTNFYETEARAGVTVPSLSTSGYVITATVSEPFTTVEQVIVFPNLEAVPALSCLQIEVASPSGTKSILLHAASGFAQTSVSGARILSNAFYGERVNGAWKITYLNFCSGQARFSATLPQRFLFVGR